MVLRVAVLIKPTLTGVTCVGLVMFVSVTLKPNLCHSKANPIRILGIDTEQTEVSMLN